MALISIAADKGAPGVTTTALALAAVWPRPVLLAECDPAGGDLVYRLPGVSGEPLDPRRGLLSLAVAARRGGQPGQVWEHAQKLYGGLDALLGVTNAEQGSGLHLLWGPLGKLLAGLGEADVIADCGRLGTDGPQYDLLAESTAVVLVTRPAFGEVIRLRDRVSSVVTSFEKRGRRGFRPAVAVIADQKNLQAALGEVGEVVVQNGTAIVLGGIAHDPKAAGQLAGGWGGRLDKSMLIRSARDIAGKLCATLPSAQSEAPYSQPAMDHAAYVQQPEPSAQPQPQPPQAQQSADPRYSPRHPRDPDGGERQWTTV